MFYLTFYHLSNRYLSNIMKIRAKINSMRNRAYQHFTFCSFTDLNKLKALQLRQAYWQSSINTVKIWHHGQKPLEPKTHEKIQIVCKSLFTKGVQYPPLARTHAWRRFLYWSIEVSVMLYLKSDHTAKCSFSLSTVFTVTCCHCSQSVLKASHSEHSLHHSPHNVVDWI